MTRHLAPTSQTDAVESNRVCFGRPEEVASLILFLTSHESSYINGSEFTIDDADTTGAGFSYRRS